MSFLSRIGCKTLVGLLLLSTTLTSAHGAVIGTQQAIEAEHNAAAAVRVQQFMASEQARAALVRMGVDPEEAMARVATLTPDEMLQLAERIDHLPAGEFGVVETIGLVAVVLLVLELMGVTNAFTNF